MYVQMSQQPLCLYVHGGMFVYTNVHTDFSILDFDDFSNLLKHPRYLSYAVFQLPFFVEFIEQSPFIQYTLFLIFIAYNFVLYPFRLRDHKYIQQQPFFIFEKVRQKIVSTPIIFKKLFSKIIILHTYQFSFLGSHSLKFFDYKIFQKVETFSASVPTYCLKISTGTLDYFIGGGPNY